MSVNAELETMRPNPTWDAASYEDAVSTLSRDDLAFKVWGGDWCKDCRSQLPDFGAALDAADVPDERVDHYPVEKEEDGTKVGPRVEEYGVEYIPTVVVERVSQRDTDSARGEATDSRARDGDEVARFVEEESVPIAVYLADRIAAADE